MIRKHWRFTKKLDYMLFHYLIINVVLLFEMSKNTVSENSEIVKTKKGRIMLSTKCAVCDSKKLRLIKEQEATGLLIK